MMASEFAGALRYRVRIERLTVARTASGLQRDQWEKLCDCLAAITPEGVGPESQAMALAANQRLTVTIRARPGIEVGQRVVWGARRLIIIPRVDDPGLRDRIMLRCEEGR